MDEYYTVSQLAKIWKLHPITIRRYIREGKLNATKIGGRVRISRDQADNMTKAIHETPRRGRPPQLTNTVIRRPFDETNPLWRLKGIGASTQ